MARGAEYFDVFFPYSSVDTGQRFFFFSTLLGDPYDLGVVAQLGDDAEKAILGGIPNNEIKSNDGEIIIQQALNFLQKTALFERQQEIAFFQEHINANENLTPKMRQDLMKLVSGNSIDYLQFIALINIFFQGATEFKENLNYEVDRLHEFNIELQKFKALLNSNKRSITRKYKKKDGSHSEEQLFYMFNQYLADIDHNDLKEDVARRLINTQTITGRISTSLRNTYEKIWKNTDWTNMVANYFKQNNLNNLPNEAEIKKGFTLLLLNQLIQTSRSEIIEILESNDELLSNKGLPDFITTSLASNFMQSIRINEDDGSYESDIMPLMSELSTKLKDPKILKEIQTVYNKAFKQLGDIKGTKKDEKHTRAAISGLTKEAVEVLENWLSKNSTFQVDKKANFSQRRAQLIKALASHLNIKIIQNNGRKDYTQIAKAADTIIKQNYDPTVRLSAKSPFLSELIAGQLESAIFKAFSVGFTNPSAKADNTFIEIAKVELGSQINFDAIAEEITKNYLDTFNNRKLSITFDGAEKSFDEKSMRDEMGIKSNEYSILIETERRLVALEKLYNDLEEQLKADGLTAQEITSALDKLRESFVVDTSVKNYDKLDNTQGFHGGSIGGSLEQQVENIYTMFSYGGITLPDLNWLLFSIYNCGPGLVGGGTGVKEKIEDLFSTVAVMLLFEDAGEQARYIQQQANERFTQPQHRFLHLYNLNGTFFPQSFILQLTYNSLVEASNILTGVENMSNGSRANIINPVNINNMSGETKSGERITKNGRKQKYNYKTVTSKSNWFETFNKNKGAVSIQITFLAGFLDILDAINQRMGELRY